MRRLLPFVCAVIIVDTMLYAALTPLLPHFERSYDLSKGGVGLLAAAYGIGTLAGAFPAGLSAARLGARTAVLGGLVGVSLASVGVALSGNYGELLAARLVQGFASSQTWAGALAWLALSTPREKRGQTMGTVMAAGVFGALLGPVIGAGGAWLGVRAAFASVAGVCALLAVAMARFEPSPPETEPARAVLDAVRNPEFLRGLWLITLPALLFGTQNVLVPLALDHRGFSAAAIGAVWIGATAIEVVINPLIGRVSDRRGPLVPIRFALVGSILFAFGLAGTEWPWLLVPLVLGASIAFGAFYAPGLTMLSHAAENVGLAQGLSFGLMNGAWALGNAVGPAAGGGLAELTSDAVPYTGLAGICAVTLLLLRRVSPAAEPQVTVTS
jgi:predicted MFS family arabinose efflux permease